MGTTVCVFAGMYFPFGGHAIKELERPSNLKVEILRGNHTRAALLELIKEGELPKQAVAVKLYRDLSKPTFPYNASTLKTVEIIRPSSCRGVKGRIKGSVD